MNRNCFNHETNFLRDHSEMLIWSQLESRDDILHLKQYCSLFNHPFHAGWYALYTNTLSIHLHLSCHLHYTMLIYMHLTLQPRIFIYLNKLWYHPYCRSRQSTGLILLSDMSSHLFPNKSIWLRGSVSFISPLWIEIKKYSCCSKLSVKCKTMIW